MNFSIRDGKFDVVILSGPRIDLWPSPGIRVLSSLCAEMGLTVGQYGGESITVRGIVPLAGTGAIAIIEDNQNRIHRIKARAVVRIVPETHLPDPFPGWYSPGLLPLSTAERLFQESDLIWNPSTVILGTGNAALKFGTALLNEGTDEVICVETLGSWGAKKYSGWEVQLRQFEMNGGKVLQAEPVELVSQGPLKWLLRLKDSQGIRVVEVARVVSAGPFRLQSGIREHPPGSCLFEMDQTASRQLVHDVEGWLLEEERGRWLAGKVVRALGTRPTEFDRVIKKAKTRVKHYFDHRENPFQPQFEGKWLSVDQAQSIKNFSGTPKELHRSIPIASIECFEEISCQICEKVCPTQAIHVNLTARKENKILREADCTACLQCIRSCPTGSIPLLKENPNSSQITLPWNGKKPWKVGETATLLNRKGETLGSARISKVDPEIVPTEKQNPFETASQETLTTVQLVQLDVPTHLLWEARSIKRTRTPAAEDLAYLAAVDRSATRAEKVEVLMDGEKRWVRDKVPVSIALFETGLNRPGDVLLCKDGSCGLCQINVDGISKPACQTKIHKGMSIRLSETKGSAYPKNDISNLKLDGWGPNAIVTTPHVGMPRDTQTLNNQQALCPCLGITREQVAERLKQGEIHSPEALRAITHLGEGKCHGQICMPALVRLLMEEGFSVSQWIDWRFPWADWKINS